MRATSLLICTLFAFDCGGGSSHSRDAGGGGDLSLGGPDGCSEGCTAPDLGVGGPDAGAGGDLGPSSGISLLAGAIGGSGTADHVGADARFNAPGGILFDGNDTLYVADSFNGSIRKVSISTKTVTTLAGKSGSDPGSDDGDSATARFDTPAGLALDSVGGRLLVADSLNCTVRAVNLATGNVSTLAGSAGDCQLIDGAAQDARFSTVNWLWLDSARNLYIVDVGSTAIRQIALADSSLQVTTYLNLFNQNNYQMLAGITGDATGNLYVSDSSNNTILQIAPPASQSAKPTVTTIAGQAGVGGGNVDGPVATASFASPTGLLLVGSTLYIAQAGFDSTSSVSVDVSAIRALDLQTKQVSHVTSMQVTGAGSVDGPAQSASFAQPNAICGDATNLFIADFGNNTVRQLAIASNTVTTLVGRASAAGHVDGTGPDARFGSLMAVAFDGNGHAYVSEEGFAGVSGTYIRRVDVQSGAVETIAGDGFDGYDNNAPGSFKQPQGLLVDGTGSLFIADTFNNVIRAIDSSGTISTLAGKPPGGIFGNGGFVDGRGAAAKFRLPTGLAIDSAGLLYVADTENHAIRTVDSTGTVATIAGNGQPGMDDGTGMDASFNEPHGLALDGAGHLLVADTSNSVIRSIDLATQAVTTLPAQFTAPIALAISGTVLYVSDGPTILRYTPGDLTAEVVFGVAGEAGVLLGAAPGGLNAPSGIAVLPDGKLLVVDSVEAAVLVARP